MCLSPGLKQSLKSTILSKQDMIESNIGRSKVSDDLERRIGSPVKEAIRRGKIPAFQWGGFSSLGASNSDIQEFTNLSGSGGRR